MKRLAAIHDVGAMTVLCTDKTGTLTQARIALAGHPGVDGADSMRVLEELAAVNSGFESKQRSPLDNAILAGAGGVSRNDWRYIADVPFDFDRRRASVLVEKDGRRLLIAKGASEDILSLATQVESKDGVRPRWMTAAAPRSRSFTVPNARKACAALPSAGASFPQRRRTLVSPMKRTLFSPASAFSSTRRRKPPRRPLSASKAPVSKSRSSPAMPPRPCSIWSR